MTTFLFWNLNNQPLQEIITQLSLYYDIDVLIFAEFSIERDVLLRTLNQKARPKFFYAPSIGCERIKIFTRFLVHFIKPVFESDRLTIRHLCLPGQTDILLAVNHFPSKIHWDDSSQGQESVALAMDIRSTEERIGHSRTILVGDLNMNPFEDGVVSAIGLHAVMSRGVAEKKERVVQQKRYPFFYNPMWNLFGDASLGPPGTYYYSKSRQKEYFWNIFDQVLIRPNLLSSFDNRELLILDSVGNTSLLKTDGLPSVSDHLPILFRLNL